MIEPGEKKWKINKGRGECTHSSMSFSQAWEPTLWWFLMVGSLWYSCLPVMNTTLMPIAGRDGGGSGSCGYSVYPPASVLAATIFARPPA
jgi:hypothetical protein